MSKTCNDPRRRSRSPRQPPTPVAVAAVLSPQRPAHTCPLRACSDSGCGDGRVMAGLFLGTQFGKRRRRHAAQAPHSVMGGPHAPSQSPMFQVHGHTHTRRPCRPSHPAAVGARRCGAPHHQRSPFQGGQCKPPHPHHACTQAHTHTHACAHTRAAAVVHLMMRVVCAR